MALTDVLWKSGKLQAVSATELYSVSSTVDSALIKLENAEMLTVSKRILKKVFASTNTFKNPPKILLRKKNAIKGCVHYYMLVTSVIIQ